MKDILPLETALPNEPRLSGTRGAASPSRADVRDTVLRSYEHELGEREGGRGRRRPVHPLQQLISGERGTTPR